ncbi:hypothetical protein JGU66_26850 [Myxococcaceae bacterium JPH2]|nr:hypothetical protein [Myxococcaceae bacterium JPH2]
MRCCARHLLRTSIQVSAMHRIRLELLRAPSLLALLSLGAAHAAAPIAATPATTTQFAGKSLTLREQEGRCALVQPDGTTLRLELRWPCQFHRDAKGALRTKKVRDTTVFLVEHSQPQPAPSRDCDTYVLAVRTHGDGLEASTAMHVAACLPFTWDAKIFIALF